MTSKEYDVIVVGAGPAGCSAAYFCAKYGLHVLLVDKAAFPRDKVCGDSISPRSLKVLERMGLLVRIEEGHFYRIRGIIMSSPNLNMMKGETPKVEGKFDYGYVIPRKTFDSMLLSHVKKKKVEVIEGLEITGLMYEGNKVAGVKSSDGLEAKCQIVVGADGVYSKVAKNAGIYPTDPNHEAIVARAYFNGVEGLEHYIEIHADSKILPGYGWVFPVNDTFANVGVGCIKTYLSQKEENLKKVFEYFVAENPFVKKKLAHARMVTPLRAWPERFGSMSKNCTSNGVILVGDAASFVDPGSGEGIYQALRSGELAAEVIHNAFSKGDFSAKTLKEYERKWKEDFSPDFKYGKKSANISATKPFLLNAQIKKAARNDAVAAAITGTICGIYSKKKLFTPRCVMRFFFS
ncbi:MAG: NAD(P)/FAD-dependent oxidoreductase [Candidatus Aminicenantes bacterium]|nr:NAD(P)/FAD-dependent oxidoreductase [Candidatus Aminicenantes bacterium]